MTNLIKALDQIFTGFFAAAGIGSLVVLAVAVYAWAPR